MNELVKSKGRWIIGGSITALLLLPTVFIAGLIAGVHIKESISLTMDSLSSWVSAIATVAIAILTIVLAKETWALRFIQLTQMEQIRKDSLKPSIGLYLKANPAAGFNFVDIHIANNGVGVAQNIKFIFKNINDDTQDVYECLLEQLNKLIILEKGINSLSPGEGRTSYVFSFIDLHQMFGERTMECVVEVIIEFEDIEGKKYSSKSFFNFAEYKGMSQLGDSEPLHRISKHLEKIQTDIGHLTSGYKRIKADVYSSKDRQEEREKQRREFFKEQQIENG